MVALHSLFTASLALLLLVSSASAVTPPSVIQTSANATTSGPIAGILYTVTVPSLPTIQAQGGYEFHAGILSNDNSTFIKSTVSYGCQVGASYPCASPYLNRYTFYVSVVNMNQLCGNGAYNCRTQYPSKGWNLSVGGTYQIETIVNKGCLTIKAWNSTASYSNKVCGSVFSLTYQTVSAAMLEEHNITSCAQLTSQGNYTQQGFGAYSANSQRYAVTWTNHIYGTNCAYQVKESGYSMTVSW